MEHRVGDLVKGQAILGLEGHVIGVVGQQNQVVAAVHIQRLDDLIIERLTHRRVFEFSLPQRHQQLVLGAVHDLPGRKHDVDQVLALGAGEGFLRKPRYFSASSGGMVARDSSR